LVGNFFLGETDPEGVHDLLMARLLFERLPPALLSDGLLTGGRRWRPKLIHVFERNFLADSAISGSQATPDLLDHLVASDFFQKADQLFGLLKVMLVGGQGKE
jgi:hypothetical protein